MCTYVPHSAKEETNVLQDDAGPRKGKEKSADCEDKVGRKRDM